MYSCQIPYNNCIFRNMNWRFFFLMAETAHIYIKPETKLHFQANKLPAVSHSQIIWKYTLNSAHTTTFYKSIYAILNHSPTNTYHHRIRFCVHSLLTFPYISVSAQYTKCTKLFIHISAKVDKPNMNMVYVRTQFCRFKLWFACWV